MAYFVVGGFTIGPGPDLQTCWARPAPSAVTASWVVGALGCLAAIWAIWSSRRAKSGHGFAVKPVWAEVVVTLIACALILGLVAQLTPS